MTAEFRRASLGRPSEPAGVGDILAQQRQYLAARRRAYAAVFTGPAAEIVLADMAAFCRARESTFHPDARAAAQLDGRREVFLRIQEHIQLSDDDLWALKQEHG